MKKINLFLILSFLFSLQTMGQTLVNGIYYTFSGTEATVVAKEIDNRVSKTPEYIGDITIPAMVENDGITYNVTRIGEYAFSACLALTSINIPEGVKYIGMFAFVQCMNLTSVIIPDGMEIIDMWAFAGCINLTSVIIPDGVTMIGEYAFYYCLNLTDVYLPCTADVAADAFEGSDNVILHYYGECDVKVQETASLESEITGYEYYTISGIKLSGKPAERGMIYIERAIMSDGRIESRKFLNK